MVVNEYPLWKFASILVSSRLPSGCEHLGSHLLMLKWWKMDAWQGKGIDYQNGRSESGSWMYVTISTNTTHHSNGEIVGHCRNMYCPLSYLNPWGLDMSKLKTFPGSTETCSDQEVELGEHFYFFFLVTYITSAWIQLLFFCQFTFNTLTE